MPNTVALSMLSMSWLTGWLCRSSDPRGLKSGRLSDLGELGEGDMAAMLPVVGEDELFLGDAEGVGLAVPPSRKRQRLVSAHCDRRWLWGKEEW